MHYHTIDLAALNRLDAQMRQAPEAVTAELMAAMTEADLLVLREVQERTPRAQGTLRSSEHHVERLRGPFAVEGLVGSPLNYAQPVELGTRPHFPPVEALIDWVKVKFGISDERLARSAAYLVARKISRVGTKGAAMFGDALAACEPQLAEIFGGAQARIAARITGSSTA